MMGPIPAKYFWPGFCVAWLVLSLGFSVATIVAAQSDGGAEVVGDYHMEKDERRAEREQHRENRQLDWTVELSVADDVEAGDVATVTLRVRDDEGDYIEGLEGRIELYSPAKAEPVGRARIRSAPERAGSYRADLQFPRTGTWDFDVEVGDGTRDYTTRIRKRL